MTQKIILQLEIDDSQLDAAQAKLDKYIAALEHAAELSNTLKVRVNADAFKDMRSGSLLECGLIIKGE